VEVHPALALWLWCRQGKAIKPQQWPYKKKAFIRNGKRLWDFLRERLKAAKLDSIPNDLHPENDGQLDAFIAWALGTLWLQNPGEVFLLGTCGLGCMLVPNVDDLQQRLAEFKNSLARLQHENSTDE
jgi:predicted RNase H-like nuclease